VRTAWVARPVCGRLSVTRQDNTQPSTGVKPRTAPDHGGVPSIRENAGLMSKALTQSLNLFLELELLSFHFADLCKVRRGSPGFSVDLSVQIPMSVVQFADPRFDSHAFASSVPRHHKCIMEVLACLITNYCRA
jgi:hypothetical protein